MRKLHVVTEFNFNPLVGLCPPMGESLCVPDQTLTVEQLRDRYIRGLPVGNQAPVMDVDGDITVLDGLNKFERIDFSRQLAERKKVIDQEFRAKQKASDEVKRKAQYDADVAAAAKSLNTRDSGLPSGGSPKPEG